MHAKRLIPLLLVLASLAAYWWLFLAQRMPSVENALARVSTGEQGEEAEAFPRNQVFSFLFRPDILAESWFGRPPEISLWDRLPLAAIAGGIVLWAAALGWLLLALIRADTGLTRCEVFVFSTAVGLNAVSTFVLSVGLCGGLHWRTVFLLPTAITVAAAAWLWWRRRGVSATAVPASAGNGLSRHWLWLAAPAVAVIVLGGMLPPADFDVREYHLEAPKEFYQQGRITLLAHNVYANMPLGAEMLCLLGMAITGDWWLGALVGKTVIALMAPLTALGLWAAGRRLFSPAAGVVAAVVYLSIPWVVRVSTAGLVDAALGCYLFLAVYAVLLATAGEVRGLKSPGGARNASHLLITYHLPPTTYVLLAGYLAGGAVSCKYPALAYAVLPLLVWIALTGLLEAARPHDARRRLAAIGAASARVGGFVLAVAIGCGLWFGKNWALTGNPTYPLFYSTFGGKTWNSLKDEQWTAVHGPREYSFSALGSDLAKVAMTSEWLSPLVMPLAVLALLRRKGRIEWALAGYFAVVVAVWWLYTHRIDRFWIPALPLAALLAGKGACWSNDRYWRWGLGIFLVLGVTYCFLAAAAIPVEGNYNRYFVGLDRARRDKQRVGIAHSYLNASMHQGRVLLVGDAEPFDLEMPVLYNTCFDDSIFEQLVKDRTPEQIRTAFAEHEITYVFVHWAEIRRYRQTYGFTSFVRSDVFHELVEDGILKLDFSWPPDGDRQIAGSYWRAPQVVAEGYRVLPPGASGASEDQ
jgi:hypothetical protein